MDGDFRQGADLDHQKAIAKRAYARPALTDYGRIETLTQAKSDEASDGSSHKSMLDDPAN